MTRTAAIGWGAVILAAVVALGQGAHQDWELKARGDLDTVRFTVRRFEPGHGRWVSSSDVSFSRFKGLSYETIDRGGKAKFEYVVDAGKLICEGSFHWGSGSGTFTAVPNPQFIFELEKLGFTGPSKEDAFSLIMSGLSLDFAREVKAAGIGASISDLENMQNMGVGITYVRELRDEGYNNLSAHDVIELHNMGVRGSYLAALKDSGYDLPVREIVNLHNMGVDPAYLRELRNTGLHPTAADLVNLHNMGVTPKFLEALKNAGYDKLSAGEMIDLHNSGVSPEFIQATRDLGYQFTVRELIDLSNNGVNSGYLHKLRDSGMRQLTASEITRLHQNGVD